MSTKNAVIWRNVLKIEGKRESIMRKIKVTMVILAAVASMNLLTGCKSDAAGETAGMESQAQDQGKDQAPDGDQAQNGQWKTDVKLEDVLAAVQKAYGDDYIPAMDYDAQAMEDLFGIGEDKYEAFFAQGPMISVNVDTFIGVRVKEGQADAVEQALEDYQKGLIEESMQYPMNIAKVNASEVVRYGDYVFFVMLGTPDMAAEEKGEEAALESAKENNQIGVEAIEACFRV